MALRSRSPGTAIDIWGRHQDTLSGILEQGLADAVHASVGDAVARAGLVVICTPVETMPGIAGEIARRLVPGTPVTDAGSVKAWVVDRLAPTLGSGYVGAHPMAGSERSGLGAARGDLFAGAPCLVTPTRESDPAALGVVRAFWEQLGCTVTEMSPAEHDRTVARLSHLPHALAFALMNLVLDTLPAGAQRLAGESFRDATRVAASNPELWTGILTSNGPEVAAALREMSKMLKSMATALGDSSTGSLLDFLRRAKHLRDGLPPAASPRAP